MTDANRRLSETAHEQADQFEATICDNIVHESIKDQHDYGPDLRRFVTVTEDVYELATDEDLEDRRLDVFGAAEEIDDHIDDVVDEVVAAALAHLFGIVDDWDDIWDEDEIEDAKCEARDWLQANQEAAERAGVWDEVTA